MFETAPTYVRSRDYNLDEVGYRSLEEMLESNGDFYENNGDNNNYNCYSDSGFVELPSDTPTPFDFGDEPPEPDEPFDTSDNPFYDDYDPFGGSGLPF